MITGPFNFRPVTKFNRLPQKVDLRQCQNLCLACKGCGILPQTFGVNHNHFPKPRPKSNKQKETELILQMKSYNLLIVE